MKPDILLLAAALAGSALSSKEPADSFDWDALAPSPDLEYHDCYAAYRCARLVLPLDWANASDPRTLSLAVIKLPALVPPEDPRFAGSVFLNPGGPGGSGVDLLRASSRRLRRVIDKPGRRHYELVSFDPRGVANSRPRADCFPGAALERDAFLLEARGTGALDAGRHAVPYMLGLHHGYARRCSAAEAAEHIFEYMSTPSVARDMVEMVDKIAELRYMGFSYGTVLGNYFAALFPERIGRLVLDGVVDAVDYATGAGWLSNIVDADEIVSRFYAGCHRAGPDVCALARSSDESGLDIRARIDAWLAAIDESPLTASISPAGSVVALTSRDIRELLGFAIYRPIEFFVPLARALDAAMAGNATQVVRLLDRRASVPHLHDACAVDGHGNRSELQTRDASLGVLCSDGDSVRDKDTPWWRRYVDAQLRKSSVMGAYWSAIRMPCAAWPFRTNWSFKGPFTTPEPRLGSAGRPVPGEPAAPILFLSNRLDPVTPLRAARAMAANHPGAGLVVQEGLGHCALATADSDCLTRIVADYFDSGAVPSEETTCHIDCGPWDDGCALSGYQDHLDASTIRRQSTLPLGVFP
ncbi:TAP-like protein [Hirsutella rhossiliensis]|uniref:TAP-like protein n=1 Tax=Hirsutella rhossiliensis TaxID=111463 RepID=A0A9P8SFP5_9HYPO|nr:TAP-like protein [Hirsutella rhossiliensis]KAH0960259.1 TAP-like protein [Hirsutella rhossiliensis]